MAFELEVRSLEAILQKEMAAKVRAAHKDNPNKVFKDIQKPKVQPVQMLKDQVTASVIEIDHDEVSVTFEGEAKFEVDQLVLSPQGPMQPIPRRHSMGWTEHQ